MSENSRMSAIVENQSAGSFYGELWRVQAMSKGGERVILRKVRKKYGLIRGEEKFVGFVMLDDVAIVAAEHIRNGVILPEAKMELFEVGREGIMEKG